MQYGKVKQELSLEQIVHGLCCDINKLEVAKSKNDDSVVKKAEDSLAYGLQTLAEVMREHLTFRRECILTAFSLTPNEDLYQKILKLAQESGFVSASSSKNEPEKAKKQISTINNEDFDSMCQDFVSNLSKGFGKAPTKIRANAVLTEKKHRNLEGLISIQGDLVTEAKNYDPVQPPLKTMTAKSLGIKRPRLVEDLLMMINAPRWHLLSWVLDWPQLEEQCQALLRNPDIKRPTKELKYLVIDYTQFDDWTSEEEITATTGIEKGFEAWQGRESDEEEAIDEKGLDPSEPIDFNVIPILKSEEMDFEEFDRDFVGPADYLPFLGLREETITARSDLADFGQDCLLSRDEVVATLQRVVPGLNDLNFASPPKNELEVRVVQVTSSQAQDSSSNTTTSTNTATTTTNSNSAARPKVQYVYKQGGQTVLIDYPMSEDAYSKLKNSNSQATVVVKQQPQQKILMSSSVDTLANSLISQITTPVNVNNGNSEETAAEKLPKFQFAFGQQRAPQSSSNTGGGEQVTNNGTKLVINSPAATASTSAVTQRCIVQTLSPKVQYSTIMRPANSTNPRQGVSVVVPVVTVEGGSAQTVIANARNVLASTQTQPTPAAASANFDNSANADLIRQLNVARAQGDVCIQQWGDKQVLVHKATGRWIMRQGNRLVTVPPQALGINTQSSTSSTTVVTSTASENKVGQTIVRSMSSSTMEQLAEFDSILESKFKSSPSPPTSLPDVVPSAATKNQIQPSSSSGPTFVIIAPASTVQSGSTMTSSNFLTTSSKNIVAVSVGGSPLKRSESLESNPASAASKVNGSLKLNSTSAPNSPIKAVKLNQQSVSANVSPTNSFAAVAAAAGFAKPPPKPQEDPDTLKRIQQILDDYNEQIRNSPDLQNRPAPRRRTNGPPTTTTGTTTTETPPPPGIPSSVSPVKKRPSLSSGSPNSSCGSESPLLIQSHGNNEFDNGSSSIVQLSSTGSNFSIEQDKPQQQGKPILRQIMVPPALAASLQATGKQLVFITGSGGKKVIAMRPLTSNMVGSTMVKTARLVSTSPNSRVIGSTTTTSPPSVVTTLASVAVSSSPTPIMAPNLTNVCSPSPPSMDGSSSVDNERPVTPILGIPMEMTPGQIMEAEISATFLDDSDDVQPQEPATSTSSSLRLDDHLQSDTLPENLFNHQPTSPTTTAVIKPPVITEETEVDTEAEEEASTLVVKRKRPSSGGSDLQDNTAKRLRTNVETSTSPGVRTRQRNLSNHLKSKVVGITESSRSSIKKS